MKKVFYLGAVLFMLLMFSACLEDYRGIRQESGNMIIDSFVGENHVHILLIPDNSSRNIWVSFSENGEDYLTQATIGAEYFDEYEELLFDLENFEDEPEVRPVDTNFTVTLNNADASQKIYELTHEIVEKDYPKLKDFYDELLVLFVQDIK